MPETDLDLLLSAAEAAGTLALRYFRADPKTWEKDGNAGPVTEADLAVDEMLQERLMAARPDYGWLSEETEDDTERLSHDRCFIIDPIDGTRTFIAGEPNWGHSLAIADKGQVIAAVIAMPVLGDVFSAAAGAGAHKNGAPLSVSTNTRIEGARLMINKRDAKPEHWTPPLPPFHHAYRQALAYRMALVAAGEYDAMITFRPVWEWDGAAGTLLIQEAGGKVVTKQGKPCGFNNRKPQVDGMIAGTPGVVDALTARR